MGDDVIKTAAPAAEPEEQEPDAPVVPEEPEAPVAPDAPETPETPEEPEAETAEQLKARIKALEDENKTLKDKDEPEDEPAGKPTAAPAKDPALTNYVKRTIPDLKKAFANATTSDEQVDVLVNATDQFVAAVLSDRQDPLNRGLAQSIIEVANGQELMELLITPKGEVDAKLASLAGQIKKSLAKMSWADRSKPGVVTSLYHQLIGKSTVAAPAGAPVKKPAGPALQGTPALKDAAAGSATGGIKRPVSKVSLTAEQEEERLSIENEGGHPYPPEKYLASLKALQDAANQNGRKIPATLRRL